MCIMNPSDNLIISYTTQNGDWYVSKFYEYLHLKLEQIFKITFTYIPIQELNELHKDSRISSCLNSNNFFNWFNLIIYNPKTDQYFLHSSHDFTFEALQDGLERGYDIVKFSCVPDTEHNLYTKYKELTVPSVYRLENWSDYETILNQPKCKHQINQAFFIGLIHNDRARLMPELSKTNLLNVVDKYSTQPKCKEDYFKTLSIYKYNLSFNGVAGLCYRDLEIFGLGNFNLRAPYTCLTYNNIQKDVHYIELFDKELISNIMDPSIDTFTQMQTRIEEVMDFCNTKQGQEILDQASLWFKENVNPDKQVAIMCKIIEESNILN